MDTYILSIYMLAWLFTLVPPAMRPWIIYTLFAENIIRPPLSARDGQRDGPLRVHTLIMLYSLLRIVVVYYVKTRDRRLGSRQRTHRIFNELIPHSRKATTCTFDAREQQQRTICFLHFTSIDPRYPVQTASRIDLDNRPSIIDHR